MISSDKQRAHDLIERLGGEQVITAVRFLEFMLLDRVARAAIMSQPDGEPVTDEDRRRFTEGQQWFTERGDKGIEMTDVLCDFGLTIDDFPIRQENRNS
jgi:hypothetical protein